MTTAAERKAKADRELGGHVGAYGGLAAGAVGGRYAAHAGVKAKHGAEAARHSYRFSQELNQLTGTGRRAGTAVKDAGTAIRTGYGVARGSPRRAFFSATAGMGLGGTAGAVAGHKGGQKAVGRYQRRKNLTKGLTMDQISKSTWVLDPKKVHDPSTKRHQVAAAGASLAGVGGAAAYGGLAGELGAAKYYRSGGGGAKKFAQSVGHGYKAALKTKFGGVGAGLAAGGIGTSLAVRHSAQKKGILIEVPKKPSVKKNASTLSAFGVEHG